MHILVVEDNETMREGMVQILRKTGYQVSEASSGNQGLNITQKHSIQIIITDYKMAGMDGISLLKRVKKEKPEIEIIIITAYGTIDVAVEAMKEGAWDFITKPFSKDELQLKVNRLARVILEREEANRLSDENRYLRDELEVHFNYSEIIGESLSMKKIYQTIEKVSKNDTSILIYGESGTGKELVARAVHFNSLRKDGPFVRVNCGALAEGVLESELFGHEKGAFTGALKQKRGRFELAHRGTLFLDEIGDIPLNTQVKLLRVIQEKEFERVGGEITIRIDVRLIAATHRNLLEEVSTGRFREDLYYRLHILPIQIPPLRERKEDIPLLSNHFLKRLGAEIGKPNLHLTQEAVQLLLSYGWPGNVRELENVLERAAVLAEKPEISERDLLFITMENKGTKIADTSWDLEANLASLERELLEKALKTTKGVKVKAAKLLGIKEGALYYKLEKYGLFGKE